MLAFALCSTDCDENLFTITPSPNISNLATVHDSNSISNMARNLAAFALFTAYSHTVAFLKLSYTVFILAHGRILVAFARFLHSSTWSSLTAFARSLHSRTRSHSGSLTAFRQLSLDLGSLAHGSRARSHSGILSLAQTFDKRGMWPKAVLVQKRYGQRPYGLWPYLFWLVLPKV